MLRVKIDGKINSEPPFGVFQIGFEEEFCFQTMLRLTYEKLQE